jgi:hypothetical protein
VSAFAEIDADSEEATEATVTEALRQAAERAAAASLPAAG